MRSGFCALSHEVPTMFSLKTAGHWTWFRSLLSKVRTPRARSIKPKFPEIPVQNQMERTISKTLFQKFRSTSRGCPFFRKLGNTGNFLFHLAFHQQIVENRSARQPAPEFLVSSPPQKRRYLLFGCNEWSPVWISYRYATSMDNSLAENMREVCTFPFSSENDF